MSENSFEHNKIWYTQVIKVSEKFLIGHYPDYAVHYLVGLEEAKEHRDTIARDKLPTPTAENTNDNAEYYAVVCCDKSGLYGFVARPFSTSREGLARKLEKRYVPWDNSIVVEHYIDKGYIVSVLSPKDGIPKHVCNTFTNLREPVAGIVAFPGEASNSIMIADALAYMTYSAALN